MQHNRSKGNGDGVPFIRCILDRSDVNHVEFPREDEDDVKLLKAKY